MLGADPASHLSTGVHQVGIFFPYDRTQVRYLSITRLVMFVRLDWMRKSWRFFYFGIGVFANAGADVDWCWWLICIYCIVCAPHHQTVVNWWHLIWLIDNWKMIKGDWRLQCQSPWHHGPWETGWLFFLQTINFLLWLWVLLSEQYQWSYFPGVFVCGDPQPRFLAGLRSTLLPERLWRLRRSDFNLVTAMSYLCVKRFTQSSSS